MAREKVANDTPMSEKKDTEKNQYDPNPLRYFFSVTVGMSCLKVCKKTDMKENNSNEL
jgi:hypothetical protein